MGRSVFDRSKPTFQPIVKRHDLTDDERRRLEPLQAVYPFVEYTDDARGMARLWFLHWYWTKQRDGMTDG